MQHYRKFVRVNRNISILIPTYNDLCLTQVKALCEQANKIPRLTYEIIVMDDASTDPCFIRQNSTVNELPNCRLVRNKKNRGRAAIRNLLAEMASYEYLIFLDSSIEIENDSFLEIYLNAMTPESDVICGGVCPELPTNQSARSCLRYLYEHNYYARHSVDCQQTEPYKSFRTTNFAIRRQTMLEVRIDERFRRFGYEDVDFGRRLSLRAVPITYIENPVVYRKYETNTAYLEKIDISLQTLKNFEIELCDYSPLVQTARRLAIIRPAVRLFHRIFCPLERLNLRGRHPSLIVLNAYKLGAFLSLCTEKQIEQYGNNKG